MCVRASYMKYIIYEIIYTVFLACWLAIYFHTQYRRDLEVVDINATLCNLC